MKVQLNKNKRIGKVIYFVEGDEDEVSLIKQIFSTIFNYSVVTFDKRNNSFTKLIKKDDKYSTVFIVPMKYSAINKIKDSQDYLDYIYGQLKKYGLDKDEMFRFFIYDRDRKSNKARDIKVLINLLKNPLDNDDEMNGLLLISYPSIEAFILNSKNDETMFKLGAEIKKYLINSKYSYVVSENSLINAVIKMAEIIYSFTGKNLATYMPEDSSNINRTIFDKEEENYNKYAKYITLSLITYSLLYLGLISFN